MTVVNTMKKTTKIKMNDVNYKQTKMKHDICDYPCTKSKKIDLSHTQNKTVKIRNKKTRAANKKIVVLIFVPCEFIFVSIRKYNSTTFKLSFKKYNNYQSHVILLLLRLLLLPLLHLVPVLLSPLFHFHSHYHYYHHHHHCYFHFEFPIWVFFLNLEYV